MAEREMLRILLREGAPTLVPAESLDRAETFATVRDGAGLLRGMSDRLLHALIDVGAHNARLAHDYQPPRFDGRMLFFSANGSSGPTTEAKAAAWRQTAAEVVVHDVACAHSDMLKPGHVAGIAAVIDPILREL
jgi:pristinamycin I synthase-3/4